MTVTTEGEARLAFTLLRKANVIANEDGGGYDNIELQVRRVGASRYVAVIQAIGPRIIDWSSL
jgi:hypothetical protein